MSSYNPPCVDMQVSTKVSKEEENSMQDPCVRISYSKSYCPNILNERNYGLQSFISGVAGFIGIFLGCSLLQIPELLEGLLYQLLEITITGKSTHTGSYHPLKKWK